jgi:hypothetical protein
VKSLLCLFISLLATFPIAGFPVDSESYERDLLGALEHLLAHDQDNAAAQLETLTQSYPNSRSGYLLYADLLAVRGGLSPAISQAMGHLERDVVSELREQLSIRWHYWHTIRATRQDLWPAALLQLSGQQKIALYMDIPAARLIVYENDGGQLKEVDNFYASIGIAGSKKRQEGDQKTPVGVYRITGFIPGRKLHERYGSGALPIDYPNKFDQIYDRTGDGIWLHGTEPGFINRAPRASDGCLSLANGDFLTLHRIIGDTPSVPVLIDSAPEWIAPPELLRRREQFSRTITRWFNARLESDTPLLDRLYSRSPYSDKLSYHSSRAQPSSGFTGFAGDLLLEDAQLFAYPGEERLYVADLWLTHGPQTKLGIRQYWHLTIDNEWQIVKEFSIPSSG